MRNIILPTALFLGAIPVALAQEYPHSWQLHRRSEPGAPVITITWEEDVESGKTVTSAWNEAGEDLYAFECGSKLKLADKVYKFKANRFGAGTFYINDKEHRIGHDTKIICSRR